ncbi:MAG: pyruvate formate lyase family protein, partial [Desulfobacteraceae bacterium]|nr:pyruvate formate lyase family protein [Desulfobacteraceae bacterium]
MEPQTIDRCEVLSPQERRIQEDQLGRENAYLASRKRVSAILNSFQAMRPKIDIERALYFTRSMRETEGQPLILRWAKAMRRIAENITVYIDPHQLLAGRAGCPGRYGILYPELDGDFLGLAIEQLPKRVESPFNITDEDARLLIEEVAPYWKGKTFHEDLAVALPEETLRLTYHPENVLLSRYIVNETASFRSSLQWVHDFEKVVKRGFASIRDEARQRLEELDPFSPVNNMEKRPFLEAIIIDCEAIITWAHRHAELAAQMAAAESDPQRKAELEHIAEICRRVPEHPARNFQEAMQSQWFAQMWSRIEQKTGTVISNGRMDQYLYPFYKQDLDASLIDEDQATEMLECMWVA